MRPIDRTLEAVIFDLDGVVADTFELHYQANRRIAEELGLPFDRTANEAFKGIGRMAVVESLVRQSGRSLSPAAVRALAERKNAHYQQLIESLTPADLLPGVAEFLRELRQAGIKLALASSSTNYRTVLTRLGVLDRFEALVDPARLRAGKPDPEIFLTAADMLGVPYAHCAAIEDGEAGLKAILTTPMFAVSVGTAPYLAAAHWQVASTRELTLSTLQQRFLQGRSDE